MPVKISERVIANIVLVFASLIWGFATIVIKLTVTEVPPLTFLMLRFVTAAIILLPVLIYILRRHKINRTRYKYIFNSSLIGHVGALILIFVGIEHTTAVNATLISSITPLLVTAMGYLILKETIRRNEIEGTLLAFLGTLIIVFSPLILAGNATQGDTLQTIRSNLLGNLLFLSGIILDAYYSIYTKRHLAGDKIVTPLAQIVISFMFAAIIFIPLGLGEQIYLHKSSNLGQLRTCTINDVDRSNYNAGMSCDSVGCYECKSCRADAIVNYLPQNDVIKYDCLLKTESPSLTSIIIGNLKTYMSPPILYGILYMSLISGVLAYVLYQTGLKHIEASEASVFYYLQPIAAIPVAMILLHETLSPLFLVGIIVITTGVWLAERRK
jgi:drug/metabolite transporter (DMT)-like permease